MVLDIEEMNVIINAEILEFLKKMGHASRTMDTFTNDSQKKARKWSGFFSQYKTTFTKIVATTNNMMRAISQASPTFILAMSDVSYQFEIMAYTVGEATAPVLEMLLPLLQNLVELFLQLPTPIQGMIGAFILGGHVIGQVSFLVQGMGIHLIALGLIALLLYTAWNENWGGIQEKTERVWEVIEPIFLGIQEVIGMIIDILQVFFEAVKIGFEAIVWYFDKWIQLINAIRGPIETVIGVVVWYFTQWYNILKTVKDILVTVKNKLGDLLGKFQPIINAINSLVEALRGFVNFIKDELLGPLKDLYNLLDDVLGKIKDIGDHLPWSPAKKGPFSKGPPKFAEYFKKAVEPVKSILVEGLVTPMAGVSPTPLIGGGTTTSTTIFSPTINVEVSGTVGSPTELEYAIENVMDRMYDEIKRRV